MSTCPTDRFSTRTTDHAGRDTMFAEVVPVPPSRGLWKTPPADHAEERPGPFALFPCANRQRDPDTSSAELSSKIEGLRFYFHQSDDSTNLRLMKISMPQKTNLVSNQASC